jgi:hypothetical protein
MAITIMLKTDNAAFDDHGNGNRAAEVARILRRLADDVENGTVPENLRDINGNHVGNVIRTGADRKGL